MFLFPLTSIAVNMSFIPQEKPHSSPLGVACGKNHLQVAQLLINNGANVNYKDGVCDNNIIVTIAFIHLKSIFSTVWQHSSLLCIQDRPP